MGRIKEAEIVIDLLERHSKVPSPEEFQELYVSRYTGRPVGRVPEPEPEPEPEPVVEPVEAAPEPVDELEMQPIEMVDAPLADEDAQAQESESHDEGIADFQRGTIEMGALDEPVDIRLDSEDDVPRQEESFQDLSSVDLDDTGSTEADAVPADEEVEEATRAIEISTEEVIEEAPRAFEISTDEEVEEATRAIEISIDDLDAVSDPEPDQPEVDAALDAALADEYEGNETISMGAISDDGTPGEQPADGSAESAANRKKKKRRHR